MSPRIHPTFSHTPYRALLPRPAPTYYRYKSMCMEIESCGGVADCMTSSASARLFRPSDVFAGGNNTRHRLRGPKRGAHDCSRSQEECPCLEDGQGHIRRGKRRQSHSHAGSTRSDVLWKSPSGMSRGRAGTPENTIIDLMTPPSPSRKRVSRNDESPRNVKTRGGSVASQHSIGSSTEMPSTARTSKDTNRFESCDICRCIMGPDSGVFTFKCGKIGSATSHKFHFGCVEPYWERCQARSLPVSTALVECPKCRRRQSVTSDKREGFDACLAERRLRLKRIARGQLNRSNRDNPVDVSESPAPAPAEASASAAGLPSALRDRVGSGGERSDGDSASSYSSIALNARNLTSGVDVFSDSDRAVSPTTTTLPNQGGGSVSSTGTPPSLASSAGVARERARAETALRAASFVRSLEASVSDESSRGGDSALDAQTAATDSATTGQEADNVQSSASSDGSGSERDFDLS